MMKDYVQEENETQYKEDIYLRRRPLASSLVMLMPNAANEEISSFSSTRPAIHFQNNCLVLRQEHN